MRSSWKALFRTRMMRATLGILVVGGVAGDIAAQSVARSVSSPAVVSSASDAASTTTPSATPTAQIVIASGVVVRIDATTNTLVIAQATGNQQTIQVSANTQFMGDVNALGQLRAGMTAQVTGQLQSDGSLIALALVTQFRDN